MSFNSCFDVWVIKYSFIRQASQLTRTKVQWKTCLLIICLIPDIAGPDLHRGRHHLSNPGRHSPLSGRDPEARGPNDRQHVRRHAQSGPHYGSRQSLRKTGICSHNLGWIRFWCHLKQNKNPTLNWYLLYFKLTFL